MSAAFMRFSIIIPVYNRDEPLQRALDSLSRQTFRLWRYRMTQSMSRRGNCWDNTPNGETVQELEVRVAPGNGIHEPAGSEAGYQLLPDGLLQLATSTSTQ